MNNFEEKKLEYEKKGFRSQVVGCVVAKKKVYFFHDKKFDLWQFPQGGVGKGESPENALSRELEEELGLKGVNDSFEYLSEDEIAFSQAHEKDGKMIVGKWYLIFVVQLSDEKEFSQEEFDEQVLVTYDEALELVEKIYQKNKREMTRRILERLKIKEIIE